MNRNINFEYYLWIDGKIIKPDYYEMLKMIVETSSNRGDIVLDCFMGSGTTLLAAEQTNRKWIGIDSSIYAINVAKNRLDAINGCTPFVFYSLDQKMMKAVK